MTSAGGYQPPPRIEALDAQIRLRQNAEVL